MRYTNVHNFRSQFHTYMLNDNANKQPIRIMHAALHWYTVKIHLWTCETVSRYYDALVILQNFATLIFLVIKLCVTHEWEKSKTCTYTHNPFIYFSFIWYVWVCRGGLWGVTQSTTPWRWITHTHSSGIWRSCSSITIFRTLPVAKCVICKFDDG